MEENSLFSVLIANYNNGQYLQECLDSIFAQTYTNWEIILVDDCSTDKSKDIYDTLYADSRIKIFKNERNRGCGFTKRKCAELASGDLCGFLDPDDTIDSKALEVMVKEHYLYPDCSLVYSNLFVCDDQLNVKYNRVPSKKPLTFDFDHTIEGISALATYKNSIYKQTKGISSDLKRAVDKDLYYKLEEYGTFHHINQTLYFYRIHSNGISNNSNFIKAEYWNWVVKIRMAERRGINLEDYYEYQMLKKIDMGKRQILNTRNYKFGKSVLDPLRTVFRVLKFNK